MKYDFSRFCPPGVTPESAEAAGFEAGSKGATLTNCHFKYFTRPSLTEAWERGKKRGDKKRRAPADTTVHKE